LVLYITGARKKKPGDIAAYCFDEFFDPLLFCYTCQVLKAIKMLNIKRLIIENNKEYVTISRETCPLFSHTAER
ncbi:MAG: hypothetical protein PUF55_05410, partial [Bacteroidales bacterium]|nr:hypothetical protein [Bacteroidales bacterium]